MEVEKKLSVEDLMRPRYKVIADYPGADYHVGEILDRDWGWVGNDEIGFKHRISDYPHIFKKLEWWQERKESDMPEYVKNMSNVPEVRKVIEYRLDRLYEVSVTLEKPFGNYDREYLFLHDTLPATESEYLTLNK